VTIGELQLGVLASADAAARARRAAHLRWPEGLIRIPITEAVMVTWARLVADCRAAGVHRAVKLTDALIAATAIEHGLPVVTQDEDYSQMSRAHPTLRVISV